MKPAAFFLLLAGWGLILSALGLLGPGIEQDSFILAGLAVEMLGLVLAFRSHFPVRSERG